MRDDRGRSLFEVIRNGHWDAAFFQRVCAALGPAARIERGPLSDEAQKLLLHISITAFAAKDKWPFDSDSAEYRGLSRVVSALYEAAMGSERQAGQPLPDERA